MAYKVNHRLPLGLIVFSILLSYPLHAQSDSSKHHYVVVDSVFRNIISVKSEPRGVPNFYLDWNTALVLYNHLSQNQLFTTTSYGLVCSYRFNPRHQFNIALTHISGAALDTLNSYRASTTFYDKAHYMADVGYTWYFKDKMKIHNYYYETNIALLHNYQLDEDDRACILQTEKLQGISLGYKGIEGISGINVYQLKPGESGNIYDATHKIADIRQLMQDHIISLGYKLETIRHQKMEIECTNFYHNGKTFTKHETEQYATINNLYANILYSPYFGVKDLAYPQNTFRFNSSVKNHIGFSTGYVLRFGGGFTSIDFLRLEISHYPGYGWYSAISFAIMDFSILQFRLRKKVMEYHYNV